MDYIIDSLERKFCTYLFCDLVFGTKSDYASLLLDFPGRINLGSESYITNGEYTPEFQSSARNLIYEMILLNKYPNKSKLSRKFPSDLEGTEKSRKEMWEQRFIGLQ